MTDRRWFVFGSLHCAALLAAALLATPAAAQQRDLTEARATTYRGQEGKRITVVCTPKAEMGRVWGTDVYTDDSSICGAAVHAGVISAAEGGAVTAVITGGRPSYAASERNGVTSRSYGEFPGSFTVEKGDGGEIDWSTRAAGLERLRGPLALTCPPTKSVSPSTVWGSDTYSDDTAICAAAVHAGVITPARGGRVLIEPAPGRTSYRGTSRNGVRSLDYGQWAKSFRFEGVVAEAEPGPMVAAARTGTSQKVVARGTPAETSRVMREAAPTSQPPLQKVIANTGASAPTASSATSTGKEPIPAAAAQTVGTGGILQITTPPMSVAPPAQSILSVVAPVVAINGLPVVILEIVTPPMRVSQ